MDRRESRQGGRLAAGHWRSLTEMNDVKGAPGDRGPLDVRRASIADAEHIARVHTQAWQAAYLGILDDAYLAALDWHERAVRWLDLLSGDDGVIVLVAERERRVVGFATGGRGRDPDSLDADEVYAIYVLPEQWGHGIGSRLIAHLIAEFAPDSSPSLWVLEANTPAITFYTHHGFVADGASKAAHIGGRDVREIRLVRQPWPKAPKP